MQTIELGMSDGTPGSDEFWEPGAFPLLSLPAELLHLLLGMLDCPELLALLRTSRSMAQHVMRHSRRSLAYTERLKAGRNWTAIRQLLQWAPPACMTFTVWCPDTPYICPPERHAELQHVCKDALGSLLGSPSTGTTPQQKFTCISKVCWQSLVLPWLIPPGLPDTCPDVHTVELRFCTITAPDSCNNTDDTDNADSSKVRISACSQRPVAASITDLHFQDNNLPPLDSAVTSCIQTAQQQLRTSSITEQFRTSLPNVTRLKLSGKGCSPELVSVWAAQLTELTFGWCPKYSAASVQLHQLRKLILEDLTICHADELKALLALPKLTHLELDSIYDITEDLSSHACSWQYLKFHVQNMALYLMGLASVPLHSLTSPLSLGSGAVPVFLPDPSSADSLARLRQAVDRMLQHGVKVFADDVIYAPSRNQQAQLFAEADAQYAAQLLAVGRVFGGATSVKLRGWTTVGPETIQALGTTHKDRLRELELQDIDAVFTQQAAWDALLTGLPALHELILKREPYCRGKGALCVACQQLVAAMARQPPGRCLAVHFCAYDAAMPDLTEHSLELSTMEGVEFTNGRCGDDMVVTVTRIKAQASTS